MCLEVECEVMDQRREGGEGKSAEEEVCSRRRKACEMYCQGLSGDSRRCGSRENVCNDGVCRC